MIADTATNCTLWQNLSLCVQMTSLGVSRAGVYGPPREVHLILLFHLCEE